MDGCKERRIDRGKVSNPSMDHHLRADPTPPFRTVLVVEIPIPCIPNPTPLPRYLLPLSTPSLTPESLNGVLELQIGTAKQGLLPPPILVCLVGVPGFLLGSICQC